MKDGEDGLKYYIEKTNKKKEGKSYGGYLKTLFDLDLYSDFQEEQEKRNQAEKIEKEFMAMSGAQIKQLSEAGNSWAMREVERRKNLERIEQLKTDGNTPFFRSKSLNE